MPYFFYFYSSISAIALIVHLIINWEQLFGWRNVKPRAGTHEFRHFLVCLSIFFVADILWGILAALKYPAFSSPKDAATHGVDTLLEGPRSVAAIDDGRDGSSCAPSPLMQSLWRSHTSRAADRASRTDDRASSASLEEPGRKVTLARVRQKRNNRLAREFGALREFKRRPERRAG